MRAVTAYEPSGVPVRRVILVLSRSVSDVSYNGEVMRRVDSTKTHPFLARHIAKSEVLRSGWTLGKLVFLTTGQ